MTLNIYDLEGNTALYKVLGVEQDASTQSIRKAYYKLSLIYHPDKNPDGESVFREISFAHSILSDPEKRAMYDNKTLKYSLQERARKEYSPEMDPNVELGPEELQNFVEKLHAEEKSKEQERNKFKQLCKEEMCRRMEYEARHPEENARIVKDLETLLSQPRDKVVASMGQGKGGCLRLEPPICTTAEQLARLQQEEEYFYEIRGGSVPPERPTLMRSDVPSSLQTAAVNSIKHQMLDRFRRSHSGAPLRQASDFLISTPATNSKLDFVKNQAMHPGYSDTIRERLRGFENFDYLSFVERGMTDCATIDKASLADALFHYMGDK